MNIATQLDFFIDPVNFLSAWDISLACKPTWESPISPSISALGTSAATESTTIISIAPLLISASAISSACSPVSGWDIIKLSMSTPNAFAYTGSSACSASINAAIPPCFCASATVWSATVVLPEDSGPYTSIILPFGSPPIPTAISRPIDPVDITSIAIDVASPSFITDPLPNSFSILPNAWLSAFSFSCSILIYIIPFISTNTKHSFYFI